jgi:hypothetical protein
VAVDIFPGKKNEKRDQHRHGPEDDPGRDEHPYPFLAGFLHLVLFPRPDTLYPDSQKVNTFFPYVYMCWILNIHIFLETWKARIVGYHDK